MNTLRPLSSPFIRSIIILSTLLVSTCLLSYLIGFDPYLIMERFKGSFLLHALRALFRLFGLEMPICLLLSLVALVGGCSSLHMDDNSAGGHGNPGNASSERFTYTSDLEEDSASSGRSRSISSVNQPAPPEPQHPLDGGAPQPLIVDEARRLQLYHRYLLLNIGGSENLQRMESILNSQFFIEKSVEAALVEDGFDPQSILHKYTPLRGYIHSPFGNILSEGTYRSYVTQIENGEVRESVPYTRIRKALNTYNLIL